MEFLLLFIDRKDAPPATPAGRAAVSALADELASRGQLPRTARLAPPAEGVGVTQRDARLVVTDGPFAESREVVGGLWVLEAETREEAIAIARRAFELGESRSGAIDVNEIAHRYCVAPDPGKGTPWLFAFHNDPHIDDCDGAKLAEMVAYGEALAREGKLFETTPLRFATPPARVESRGGKTLVTEGPFAEAKEVIGGYTLLRAASRDEALVIARGYPARKWGTVELREIVPCG